MIGKIIGGIAGAKMAKSQPGGLRGPGGALLGIGEATLPRRLSLPAMLAVSVGMVKEEEPVAEIVAKLMRESEDALGRR